MATIVTVLLMHAHFVRWSVARRPITTFHADLRELINEWTIRGAAIQCHWLPILTNEENAMKSTADRADGYSLVLEKGTNQPITQRQSLLK